MKILGFYEELWPPAAGNPEGPISDFVRDFPQPDQDAIVEYLDSGCEILSFMGSVKDVLGSDERIVGGDNILTDGEWVWRGDLWFYVLTYHLALPGEFLQQVRARQYVAPDVSSEQRVAAYEQVRQVL
ncbi:hypothetical protein EF912_00440 [Streptomyces sp. WAC07061]|uniref:hypothetical protein n=1 Tax=Streptomyces sp. WAC07061 TaxID=2487410 RepID=UPI000F766C7A|nr:hypothetical protein [Streptomyces sp. WAC07061]RSS65981.1 hypothetical protein EF912_00440 [Streptomyces sp. WAC07061]